MKINRGDSQDKGSQSRQAYHAAPAPAPKRPVQPDPDPQDLYEDAEGPDEYAEDDDDEPVRRRFPIGLVVLVVILAIVGIGGWKVFQFTAKLPATANSARSRPLPLNRVPLLQTSQTF